MAEIKIIKQKYTDIYNIPKIERDEISKNISVNITGDDKYLDYIKYLIDSITKNQTILYLKDQPEQLIRYIITTPYAIAIEDLNNKYPQVRVNDIIHTIRDEDCLSNNCNLLIFNKAKGETFRIKGVVINFDLQKFINKNINKGENIYEIYDVSEFEKKKGKELVNIIYNMNNYLESSYLYIWKIIITPFKPPIKESIFVPKYELIKLTDNFKILSKHLSELHDANFSDNYYNLSLAYKIDSIGSNFIKLFVDFNGVDNNTIYDFIENEKTTKQQEIFARRENKILFQNIFEFNQKLAIAKNKFSNKRYKYITSILQSQQFNTFEEFSNTVLNKKETQIINLAFENKIRYWKSIASNKCPHVKSYFNFRKFSTIDLYLQYKQFFGQNKNTTKEYIKCKLCKFDLLCPHLRDMYELKIKKTKFSEIKKELSKYFSDKTYQFSFYCKICGEDILQLKNTKLEKDKNADKSNLTVMIDEFRNTIWKEFMILIHRNVLFNKLTSIYDLVNDMIEKCYPLIQDDKVRLEKSIANTEKDVEDKLNIYIPMYGYVYLLQLIKDNKFNNNIIFKDYQKAKGKSAIIKYFNTIIKFLSYKIPKSQIKTYYKLLITIDKKLTDQITNIKMVDKEKLFIYEMIGTEVIYQYIKYIINIGKYKNTKINYVKQLEYILKINFKKIPKNLILFDKNRIQKPNYNLIKKLNKNPPYTKNNIDYIINSYNEFLDITNNIKLNKNNHDELLNLEKNILANRYYYYYKCSILEYETSSVIPDYNITFAEVYNPDGNLYDWKYYVYQDGKEKVELTKKEIGKLRLSGDNKMKNYKFIDMKSADGYYRSQLNELNNNDIKKTLDEKFIFENFYKFYENQCPDGGVHKFNNQHICEKCGWKLGNITSKDYYNKYKEKYFIIFKEIFQENQVDIKPPIIYIIENNKNIDKYKYNPNVINKSIDKFNLNENAIKNLGNTEFYSYKDVLKNKIPKYKPNYNYNHRIVKLYSYILMIISEYNSLRFYDEYLTHNDSIKLFLNNAIKEINFPLHKIGMLKKLPDISSDPDTNIKYIKMYDYMRAKFTPMKLTDYLLQSIFSIIMKISDIKGGDSDIKKLIELFVKYILAKIKYDEEITSYIDRLVLNEAETNNIETLDEFGDDDQIIGKPDDVYGVDEKDFTVDNDFSDMDYSGHNEDDDPDID